MPQKIRILLLEDNPEDATLIDRELKKAGLNYELTRVDKLEDYVEVLQSNPPDLILSDYKLPQWTALDALRIMQERRKQTPFILVSGSQSEEVLIALMRAGASDYILKDRLGRIANSIADALTRHGLESEHRRAQEFIKESEEQYRVLFNKNPYPMWVCNSQTLAILAVNQAAINQYEYSISEYLQMSLTTLFPKEMTSIIIQSVAQLKAFEGADMTSAGVWKLRKKDGSIVYVDTVWSPILFYGNKVILVMGSNVTSSVLAYRRKAAQYAVAQALTYAHTLDEAAPRILEAIGENFEWDYGALWMLTTPAKELRCVKAWPALGLDFPELDQAILSPASVSTDTVLHSREPFWVQDIGRSNLPSHIVAAAKTNFKSATIVPISDGNSHFGTMMFLSRTLEQPDPDLMPAMSMLGTQIGQFARRSLAETDKRGLEDQLRQAQKIEAVGRLAGGMAHDFNNLLTAISGYCDLLLESLQTDDPNRADVEEIKKAAKRAADLTRQLLTFSRKQILQPRIINLKSLLADIENMMRRMVGEDIDFSVICDPATGPIRADPGQIEQVIVNLVVNARDAVPQSGKIMIETANVALSEADARRMLGISPGPYVMLSISDTGIGMNDETKSHLFEPFFTTKGKNKGTGLGLSTAYGIIRQAEGHIAVESAPGQGSAFHIYLPLAPAGKETPVPSHIPSGNLKGSETILLVEDENTVREMAQRVLEKHGYRVLAARHGPDAIMLSKNTLESIDLLLTDVVMPEMNGHQLAEQIVSMRPAIRTILMSGYTDLPVLRQKIYDDKMVFLQKPFSPAQLVQTIRQTLDKKAV